MKKVLLSWSSGKDSAWTLHELRRCDDVEVCGLLTTLNADRGRVAMHDVREELLDAQAAATGLPLRKVRLPDPCPNDRYEAAMREAMAEAMADGVSAVAFGDLFLADIRAYREAQLGKIGVEALFPLWGRDTAALAHEMVAGGLRALLACVDTKQCPAELVGREFDGALLHDLPPGVDPCGENGEYHTLAYAGPIFDGELRLRVGETVERDGFAFADILPI